MAMACPVDVESEQRIDTGGTEQDNEQFSTTSGNKDEGNSLHGENTDQDKRTKFGQRFLTDPQNVFQHNAWDNVVWDEEQEAEARSITEKHLSQQMPEERKDELENGADGFWDKFYGQHQNRFFKDRHWLFTEFPELYRGKMPQDGGVSSSALVDTYLKEGASETSALRGENHSVTCRTAHKPIRFFEVGCGVGNTVFPVLNTNKDPDLMVYCCDFSSTAIQILKEHPDYDEKRCRAFVWDITEEKPDVPMTEGSLDIIIMIFVLSALSPDKMQGAIDRLASYLKPGGTLLFRDYGRYDMAQLRFKKGRCISENFYVRGDGTRVYFFTQDELDLMFTKAGLAKRENLVDRRLQVNRGKQLKMYRVWIQCKYVKNANSQSEEGVS